MKNDTLERGIAEQLEFDQLRMRINKIYDFEIDEMEADENGAGGLTYFVKAYDKRFVVKYPSENGLNNPEVEIKVCEELLKKGIPACIFVPNKSGELISTDENGKRFTVQHFYEGKTYEYFEAPVEKQAKSASALAKIHNAIRNMEDIPVGIGDMFFKYRKPSNMKDSYLATLQKAIANNDTRIVDNVLSNMRIIESMPDYVFDINRFSCGNTHGDYMISQLIWEDDEIKGIIDWTCTCKHPYIWEIVRSYVFMAPEVKHGEVDINSLLKYISSYMKYNQLNSYDVQNAGNLFFYFLAVCDFYGQYYDSISKNRDVFLKQANMASQLLVWFEKHIDELNNRLKEFKNDQY